MPRPTDRCDEFVVSAGHEIMKNDPGAKKIQGKRDIERTKGAKEKLLSNTEKRTNTETAIEK